MRERELRVTSSLCPLSCRLFPGQTSSSAIRLVAMLHLPRAPLLLRVSCGPCITSSRGRKSRFDPPAKSKASRIKFPPAVCVEELLSVQHRYRQYSAILGAMRADFKEEMLRSRFEQQVGSFAEHRLHQEAMEHAALMAWNKEENNKALRRRLERLKVEEHAFQTLRKEAAKLRDEAELEELQERELEIQRLEELSKTFITPENLVERIEAALNNPKSYNFCLDRDGRILRPGAHQS
ncbi:28S ribosomal protein S26, mitochondrial isoform X2 [Bufo bufo]|uniref:28S ribosomal protein S26, mitochondrial isoform X1 n=1 Tax=Bufo bufo TaxID=8384 RepID=UPI001ABDFCB1|nr:28S ribosomal protein S26, mitochondrial isoform X1 [Bufo bufo]XP_040275441.1 28S ribosomal protein S26, mitochondrial isoform X2 [Bufo bufo]